MYPARTDTPRCYGKPGVGEAAARPGAWEATRRCQVRDPRSASSCRLHRAQTLWYGIGSIQVQTTLAWEPVIVDDGLAGDTASVLGQFADPRSGW